MSDTSDPVLFEVEDGVGTLTLNRPEALNALDFATITRLEEVTLEAATSAEVRAVLVTGAGRAFCAGGDVKEMLRAKSVGAGGPRPTEALMLGGVGELHDGLSGLYRLPKPVVAAVNGVAAGGGVGLALTADVVWAASSASFTLAFTAIGMSPDSGTTFLLPRAVGPKVAAELFLTNRTVHAAEARELGLASRVVPDDELLPAARHLARKLAAGPTRAYARVKALLRSSDRNGFETQLEEERRNVGASSRTSDFGEGLRAFVEKRRPEFRGE